MHADTRRDSGNFILQFSFERIKVRVASCEFSVPFMIVMFTSHRFPLMWLALVCGSYVNLNQFHSAKRRRSLWEIAPRQVTAPVSVGSS